MLSARHTESKATGGLSAFRKTHRANKKRWGHGIEATMNQKGNFKWHLLQELLVQGGGVGMDKGWA